MVVQLDRRDSLINHGNCPRDAAYFRWPAAEVAFGVMQHHLRRLEFSAIGYEQRFLLPGRFQLFDVEMSVD